VHLDAGATQPHDSTSPFNPLPLLAHCRSPVRIVDLIAGELVGYTLRSGRYEETDLREYCLVDQK
jgi:hypothetical protein